jgi:hypothetical protein
MISIWGDRDRAGDSNLSAFVLPHENDDFQIFRFLSTLKLHVAFHRRALNAPIGRSSRTTD